MNPKELIVCLLIGLPGCGKTAWRNHVIYRPEEGICVVSSDDIIEQVAKGVNSDYDSCFASLIKHADAIAKKTYLLALENSIETIVVDRTNLSTKSRRFWIEEAKHKGYKVKGLLFSPPEEEKYKAMLASRKGKTISEEVLMSMKNRFEFPQPTEGFDSISEIKPIGD